MNSEIKSAILRVLPFAIILLILIVATKKGKIAKDYLYLRKPNSSKNFFLWVSGFLVFILITEFSLYQLAVLEIDKWNHSLYPSIIRVLGTIALAPIVEELIFRGLLLSKLVERKLNIHIAILVQAFIFVLLHNFTYVSTLTTNIGIGQSLVDAILFGYARQYTKSIYTPMTMHITGNFIAILERFIL